MPQLFSFVYQTLFVEPQAILIPTLQMLARTQEDITIKAKQMASNLRKGVSGATVATGSPKAVRECLDIVMPVLPHALKMMCGGGH